MNGALVRTKQFTLCSCEGHRHVTPIILFLIANLTSMEMTKKEFKENFREIYGTEFEWPSVEELYRPSKPVLDEWEQDVAAEVAPWWVMPLIILMILGFAIILVHAQQLQTLFTN